MHETTQRRVCRVAFLTLCVLPTLALVGWGGWRLWPGRHVAVLASVGRQLGGRLTAEKISTPKPGVWRIEGLELTDPETAAPLVLVNWVEFQNGHSLIGRAGELQLLAPDTLIAGADRLLRGAWPADVRLGCEKLTLGQADAGVWHGVRWELSTKHEDGATVRRLDAAPSDGTAFLTVERRRDGPAPRSIVRLDTGDQAVPAAWLAAALAVDSDKRGASFRGRLEATVSADSAEASLAGVLAGVRPADWFGGDRLSLAAPMTVAIDRLRILSGRLAELSATCSAGGGTVDHELLYAAIERLGCRHTDALRRRWPQPADARPLKPIAFDALAFAVSLDAGGCQIVKANGHDAVLARSDEPLLMAPVSGRAPVDALLHLVSPRAERYQPATPAAAALASRLPLTTIR